MPAREHRIAPARVQPIGNETSFCPVCQRDRRVFVEKGRGVGKSAGGKEVIGIENDEIISLGPIDGAIERTMKSPILLVEDQRDTVIRRRDVFRDLLASVGRRIVDDEQTQIAVILRKYAIRALPQVPGVLIRCNCDIKSGHFLFTYPRVRRPPTFC